MENRRRPWVSVVERNRIELPTSSELNIGRSLLSRVKHRHEQTSDVELQV